MLLTVVEPQCTSSQPLTSDLALCFRELLGGVIGSSSGCAPIPSGSLQDHCLPYETAGTVNGLSQPQQSKAVARLERSLLGSREHK